MPNPDRAIRTLKCAMWALVLSPKKRRTVIQRVSARRQQQAAPAAPVIVLGTEEGAFPILRRMVALSLIAGGITYGLSAVSALNGWGFPVAEWNMLLLHASVSVIFFWMNSRTNLALRQLLRPAWARSQAG